MTSIAWLNYGGKFSGGESWTPTDQSGLELWLDFSSMTYLSQDDAKTTPVTADGQVVGACEDRSGNGRDATQDNNDHKPLYKTGIQNGLSMALGDEADDHLTFSGVSCAGNLYVLMVIKTDGDLTNYNGWIGREAQTRDYIRHNENGAVAFMSANDNSKTMTAAGAIAAGTVYLIELRRSSNDLKVWVNGADVTQGTVTDDGSAFVPTEIFQPSDFGGHIGEVLVYSVALSGSVQTSLRTWANSKWSIY